MCLLVSCMPMCLWQVDSGVGGSIFAGVTGSTADAQCDVYLTRIDATNNMADRGAGWCLSVAWAWHDVMCFEDCFLDACMHAVRVCTVTCLGSSTSAQLQPLFM